ncbi:phosphatase 2C 62 [Spatholobus suberectus]|nr:phosphatase 2C 62 [Spatholobus suberectus]
MLPNATSPSNSIPEDFDILSSTVFDRIFVFRFGNASEIREKLDALDKEKLACEGVVEKGKAGVRGLLGEIVEKLKTEVDRTCGDEIESSSTAVVVVDQNPQLLVNEKESVVLDSDQDGKLDSVEDGDDHHGILTEDVGA